MRGGVRMIEVHRASHIVYAQNLRNMNDIMNY